MTAVQDTLLDVDAPSAATWWSDPVGFSGRAGSVRTGAKFHRARFWSHVLTRPHGTGAHRHR
nr:hypothetical protein [Streptomyces viridosporus]